MPWLSGVPVPRHVLSGIVDVVTSGAVVLVVMADVVETAVDVEDASDGSSPEAPLPHAATTSINASHGASGLGCDMVISRATARAVETRYVGPTWQR
jgi:hypothetical protein